MTAPQPIDEKPAEPAPAATEEPFGQRPAPGRHPLLKPRVYGPLLGLLFVLNIPFLALWLRGPAPVTATVPFHDDFQRGTLDLGPNYFATGGFWRILDGWLYSPGVRNNPLWLKARLPHDVQVEFDARAQSPAGDIKCEIFGDGRDHESGYTLIFGGWHNTISVLARHDEHGLDRKERRDQHVVEGRTYHFKIVRKGSLLSWFIDGQPFLSWDDKKPLYGPENDRFAFGTWATDVYYDNLDIRPL